MESMGYRMLTSQSIERLFRATRGVSECRVLPAKTRSDSRRRRFEMIEPQHRLRRLSLLSPFPACIPMTMTAVRASGTHTRSPSCTVTQARDLAGKINDRRREEGGGEEKGSWVLLFPVMGRSEGPTITSSVSHDAAEECDHTMHCVRMPE